MLRTVQENVEVVLSKMHVVYAVVAELMQILIVFSGTGMVEQ